MYDQKNKKNIFVWKLNMAAEGISVISFRKIVTLFPLPVQSCVLLFFRSLNIQHDLIHRFNFAFCIPIFNITSDGTSHARFYRPICFWRNYLSIERFSGIVFTANGQRRQDETCVLAQNKETRLILINFFGLFASADIEKVLQRNKQVKIREFSSFFDKQLPGVCRLTFHENAL